MTTEKQVPLMVIGHDFQPSGEVGCYESPCGATVTGYEPGSTVVTFEGSTQCPDQRKAEEAFADMAAQSLIDEGFEGEVDESVIIEHIKVDRKEAQ